MRLLLVEDDRQLADELAGQLRQRGYAVDCTAEGKEAAFLGGSEPYDVAVLDLGLPGMAGLDVLRHWRAAKVRMPVLILTARSAWHEKVEGFRAGADDYLTKPFHSEELMVRLEALLRRANGIGEQKVIGGALHLDEGRQCVRLEEGGKSTELELTGTEFRLLRYLMLHPGKIFSASHLLEHVYEYDAEKESNVIEVYINRLRKKVGKVYIRTRRGQGYFFDPEATEEA